jgi:hypothetical protein
MGEGGGDNRTVVEVLLLQQEHAINSFLSLSLLHFLPLLFCRAGPAAAVLQLDDVITHINGTTLAGQQIDGIVSLMRGVSTIELRLLRFTVCSPSPSLPMYTPAPVAKSVARAANAAPHPFAAPPFAAFGPPSPAAGADASLVESMFATTNFGAPEVEAAAINSSMVATVAIESVEEGSVGSECPLPISTSWVAATILDESAEAASPVFNTDMSADAVDASVPPPPEPLNFLELYVPSSRSATPEELEAEKDSSVAGVDFDAKEGAFDEDAFLVAVAEDATASVHPSTALHPVDASGVVAAPTAALLEAMNCSGAAAPSTVATVEAAATGSQPGIMDASLLSDAGMGALLSARQSTPECDIGNPEDESLMRAALTEVDRRISVLVEGNEDNSEDDSESLPPPPPSPDSFLNDTVLTEAPSILVHSLMMGDPYDSSIMTASPGNNSIFNGSGMLDASMFSDAGMGALLSARQSTPECDIGNTEEEILMRAALMDVDRRISVLKSSDVEEVQQAKKAPPPVAPKPRSTDAAAIIRAMSPGPRTSTPLDIENQSFVNTSIMNGSVMISEDTRELCGLRATGAGKRVRPGQVRKALKPVNAESVLEKPLRKTGTLFSATGSIRRAVPAAKPAMKRGSQKKGSSVQALQNNSWRRQQGSPLQQQQQHANPLFKKVASPKPELQDFASKRAMWGTTV